MVDGWGGGKARERKIKIIQHFFGGRVYTLENRVRKVEALASPVCCVSSRAIPEADMRVVTECGDEGEPRCLDPERDCGLPDDDNVLAASNDRAEE